MVAPAITHRETLSADLLRAIRRAADEKLVIFKLTTGTLGVGTVTADGIVAKPYTLTIRGESAGELTCSCDAGTHGRCCKHLAAGIAARKWGVYAVRPQSMRIAVAHDPLAELFN